MLRPWRARLLLLLLAHLALGATALPAVPRTFMDEGWEASIAWALAREGRLRVLAGEGVGGMEIAFVQPRVIQPLSCAPLYALGDLGLVTCRIPAVLFGALALLAIVLLAKRWYGSDQASLVGLALLASVWFFEISRRIRPEIHLTALALLGALSLVVALDGGRRRWAFLAGVGFGAASLAHPLGAILSASLAGGLGLAYAFRRAIGQAPWVLAGALVTIAPWALYVWQSVQHPDVSFDLQMTAGRAAMVTFDLRSHLASAAEGWSQLFRLPLGLPIAASCGVAWLAAWVGGYRADRSMALALFLLALAVPYSTTPQVTRYLMPGAPLFAFLVVRLCARLWAHGPPSRLHQTAAVLFAAAWVLPGLGGIGLMLARLHGARFEAVVDRVAETAAGSPVFGEMVFWFGHDRFEYLPWPEGLAPERFPEHVRERGAHYVVRSGWGFGSGHGIRRPPAEMRPLQGRPVDRACAELGERVDAFFDPYYGAFEVYRVESPGDRGGSRAGPPDGMAVPGGPLPPLAVKRTSLPWYYGVMSDKNDYVKYDRAETGG